MGSNTDSATIVEAIVSLVTALSSAVTTNSSNPATLGVIAASIQAQVANDAGLSAVNKDFLTKISSAIAATSPSSSIRNSNYSA